MSAFTPSIVLAFKKAWRKKFRISSRRVSWDMKTIYPVSQKERRSRMTILQISLSLYECFGLETKDAAVAEDSTYVLMILSWNMETSYVSIVKILFFLYFATLKILTIYRLSGSPSQVLDF